MSVAHDLAEQLVGHLDALVKDLLPGARPRGTYWIIGSTDNERGKSLFIRRRGARVGRWEDRATGQYGDLLDLVHFCACGGRDDMAPAIRWARRWLGNERPAMPRRENRESIDADDKAAIAIAHRMWSEARPIAGTLGEKYLRSRHITLNPLPPSLRYASVVVHTPTGALLPCVVAGMSGNDGKVTAVLRTYLRLDGRGKAVVNEAKMTLGRMQKSACRLAPATTVLGIAEGIETGLSAMQIHEMVPVWCACGSRLAAIELPLGLERLIIFGDHGEGGERAVKDALAVHARAGLNIEVRLPTEPGCKDWNDAAEVEANRRHFT